MLTLNAMIIDAHIHIGNKYGWKFDPEDALKLMDEAGIDKALPTGLAEVPGEDLSEVKQLNDTLEKYPDRFPYGFLRVNPWYGQKAIEVFEESARAGRIKGIKFHPVSAPIWPYHHFATDLWKSAAKFGAPIYIHSGTDLLSLPLQIGEAAKLCPETTFFIGHYGGYFYHEDAIRVARKYENVYLETSLLQFPEMIRKGVDLVGADRIVYGSDLPPLNPIVELKKFELAGLSRKECDMILGQNIARIMGIGGA